MINFETMATDLSERTGFPKYKAKIFLEEFENLMVDYIADGETIKLQGFLHIELKECKAHAGINPKTKEPVWIPACNKIKFRLGKWLIDAVAQSSEAFEDKGTEED